MIDVNDLLVKTSRTFALAIPLLPEPTRREVGLAYLLFRIADTFEDATAWTPPRRLQALDRFAAVVDGDSAAAQELANECRRLPPTEHAGYRQLLDQMPLVLREVGDLRPASREQICRHVARSIEGMSDFVRLANARGGLVLTTLDDLRAYCYAVAGIVGEMLTELYLIERPALTEVAGGLRERAAEFGEGLQLVNILKDSEADAKEGRVFLPPGVPVRDVQRLAERDLLRAGEFVNLLRGARAQPGVVAFNAFIRGLATANLQILEERGSGAKLSRSEVARIGAEVIQGLGEAADDARPVGLDTGEGSYAGEGGGS